MPESLLPIWVASLILCASPPLKVEASLLSDKYSRPTFFKKFNLSLISLIIKNDTSVCSWFNFNLSKNSIKSLILKHVTSYIFLLFILTLKASSLSLVCLHTGQGISVIYLLIHSLIWGLVVSIYLLSKLVIIPSK